jgi:hypothetical protein
MTVWTLRNWKFFWSIGAGLMIHSASGVFTTTPDTM